MGLWRRKRSSSSGTSSNSSSGTPTEATSGLAFAELSISNSNSSNKQTTSSPATSPTSRFMRTLFRTSSTGSSRSNGGSRPSRKQPRPTPAEAQHEIRINRPLTEQNLEHQRILAAFAFNFGRSGRRRSSISGWSARSGVSPGATRHASIDSGYVPHISHGHHHLYHHGGDVDVMQPPQEIPGEESDKDQVDEFSIPVGVLPGLAGRC